MTYLCPSTHSWHIHVGHEVEPHLQLCCLENDLEKAEQEDRKVLLWLEVKKKFLEIKVFHTKRVDIEES